MPKIDRRSIKDAKTVFEKLIPDKTARSIMLQFLWEAINFADHIDSNNWNLNLDKNGSFVRFNTGHPYCIQIKRNEILILCDRTTLKPIITGLEIPVTYRGHIKKRKIHSENIDEVPDCLVKAQNSVGCLLPMKTLKRHLFHFQSSNQNFMKEAIKSRQLRQMRLAHSIGAVEYIAQFCASIQDETIKVQSSLPTFNDFIQKEALEIEKACNLNTKQRRARLKKSRRKPNTTSVLHTVFIRNPDVVLEVLHRANGCCERCKKSAPFKKDIDGSPYLEVHHIIPLARGGEDTVDNAIGLCPNCHRHAHYGRKTY